MIWIRSFIFSCLFYLYTVFWCVLLTPLLLFDRSIMIKAVQTYMRCIYIFEKAILNLDFEIRGQEHLPSHGSYIIASKHQSAYETLKLHILFGDPAIVLKKELTDIPLWGQITKKIDGIAIDRKSGEKSMQSITDSVIRMKEQERPIVIFPQGTRVPLGTPVEKKPYKSGIYKMYTASDLPVIPLAINSGLFWPKKGFLKKPGIATFEFLPPIKPGLSKTELMSKLTTDIETHSDLLLQEAVKKYGYKYTSPEDSTS